MSDLVSTGGGHNHPAGCGCPWCTSTVHAEADVTLNEPPAQAEVPTIGVGVEPVSVAHVRRTLPVGTNVQVHRLNGADEHTDPDIRTVTKQSPHEMCTLRDDGRTVHLTWAKQQAAVDEAGLIVISNEAGTPYAAIRPLVDGTTPVAGQVHVHPDLVSHRDRALTATDPAELDTLARSPLAVDRWTVAGNTHTDPHTLDRLADDESFKVRHTVAGNPNTSASTLEGLALDPGPATVPGEDRVAYLVARHQNTNQHTLRQLSRDDDAMVLGAVARNRNTSQHTLRDLAQCRDQNVRLAVASNPNTPSDVLAGWERSDGWTMSAVAKNPNTPPDVIARLAEDTSTGNQARAMAASNPSAPRHIVRTLVRDPDVWVREHAALNLNLGTNDAATLAGDNDEGVRRRLAGNAGTNPRVLAELQGDPSPAVRARLAKNPSILPQTRRALEGDNDAQVRDNARTRRGV